MNLLGLILLLLLGGCLAGSSSRVSKDIPRWISIAVLLGAGAWLISVWLEGAEGGVYAQTRIAWIEDFGISVQLEMDGLSLMLVGLTLFLGIVSVVSSWSEIESRTGFFQFNLMWTLAGVVGVFTAYDLFLLFVFWEVMLIPMYFLIAVWGHENRGYAAMKFFLFTQISGLLMLVSILALVFVNYQNTGVMTFDYHVLLEADITGQLGFWLMLGFFIAFVVKLPGVPFHTWLPDAHTQAPTAGSVILAGILLKTGAYGLIRFVVPLFPDAAIDFRWPAMALGALSVVYGGYLAFSQTDFKRLVAYSSVSHMGFVLLGVYAANQIAIQGAIMQMIAHGLSTAALFMMAGAIQQRLHTRDMSKMGGLWMRAPRMGTVTLFFVVASLGMPGLGNFVGEFMVLMGAFKTDVLLTAIAAIGIVVSAVYSLLLMQRAFQGSPTEEIGPIADFGARELTIMGLLMIGLIWLGVYPQPVFDTAQPFVDALLRSGP
ncbi:MAG: NADH-quinone oxidoreductase subunit M [Pseudomonadales bacterium]|nr:NADH-quinone oxidoreductase subunit M [Pseudomonadales bacterium]